MRSVGSEGCHPTLAQVDHIALATADLDRLCRFYRLLGAVLTWPGPSATAPQSCVLDFCGVRLEVFEWPCSRGEAEDPRPSPG